MCRSRKRARRDIGPKKSPEIAKSQRRRRNFNRLIVAAVHQKGKIAWIQKNTAVRKFTSWILMRKVGPQNW